MKGKVKKGASYCYSQKRHRQAHYFKLMFYKMKNSIKENGNSKIKKKKNYAILSKKYWSKWTDPLVIITAVLALFTYLLFKSASDQTQIAVNALRASDSTDSVMETQATLSANAAIWADTLTGRNLRTDSVRHIKDADNEVNRFKQTLALSERSFDSSMTNSKMTIQTQNNLLNTQLVAINQSQSQFEAVNRPFIQFELGTIKVKPLVVNENIQVSYTIRNAGKFPARIVQSGVTVRLAEYVHQDDVIREQEHSLPSPFSYFMGGENEELPSYALSDTPLTSTELDSIERKIYTIFLSIILVYQNAMTGHAYINKVIFALTYPTVSLRPIQMTDTTFGK